MLLLHRCLLLAHLKRTRYPVVQTGCILLGMPASLSRTECPTSPTLHPAAFSSPELKGTATCLVWRGSDFSSLLHRNVFCLVLPNAICLAHPSGTGTSTPLPQQSACLLSHLSDGASVDRFFSFSFSGLQGMKFTGFVILPFGTRQKIKRNHTIYLLRFRLFPLFTSLAPPRQQQQ